MHTPWLTWVQSECQPGTQDFPEPPPWSSLQFPPGLFQGGTLQPDQSAPARPAACPFLSPSTAVKCASPSAAHPWSLALRVFPLKLCACLPSPLPSPRLPPGDTSLATQRVR